MKKVLFSLAMVAGFSVINAQSVLFEDDFESYEDFIITDIGNWITIDVDQSPTYSFTGATYPNAYDPQAYIIFNPVAAGVEDSNTTRFSAYSGDKYALSFAAVLPADGGTGPNDDWLVSPAVTLGPSNNKVEFYVDALTDLYGDETFEIYVYEGDGVPSGPEDFEWVDGDGATYPDGWRLASFDLDYYANKTVRVAIRCTSVDAYGFKVDDFKILGAPLSVSDLDAKSSGLTPNPVKNYFQLNLTSKFNVDNLTVTVIDLAGRTVKTFAAADSYNVSDLAKGVYLVTITDGKKTETKKIVKR